MSSSSSSDKPGKKQDVPHAGGDASTTGPVLVPPTGGGSATTTTGQTPTTCNMGPHYSTPHATNSTTVPGSSAATSASTGIGFTGNSNGVDGLFGSFNLFDSNPGGGSNMFGMGFPAPGINHGVNSRLPGLFPNFNLGGHSSPVSSPKGMFADLIELNDKSMNERWPVNKNAPWPQLLVPHLEGKEKHPVYLVGSTVITLFELRVILDGIESVPTEVRNKMEWNGRKRCLEVPMEIPPVPEFTTPESGTRPPQKAPSVKVEPGTDDARFGTANSSASSATSTTTKKRKQTSSGAEDSGSERLPRQKEQRTVSVSSGGTEEDDDSDVVDVESSDDESKKDKVRSAR